MPYRIQLSTAKLLGVVLLYSLGPYLQAQNSHIQKGKVLIGSSIGSNGYTDRNPDTWEESWAVSVILQPRVGIFVTDRVLLAVQGEFQITRSSFPIDWMNDEYYGTGGLGRYHFSVLPNVFPFSNEVFQQRVKGFCEVGLYAKNGNLQGDTLVALPSLSILELQAGGGVSIQLKKSLCLEFSFFYVARPDSRYGVPFPFTPRLGLEFKIPYTT